MAAGRFWRGDSGAVTVDWVVLTAALVGLALAVMGTLRTGTFSLATTTAGALQSAQVSSLGTLGYSN